MTHDEPRQDHPSDPDTGRVDPLSSPSSSAYPDRHRRSRAAAAIRRASRRRPHRSSDARYRQYAARHTGNRPRRSRSAAVPPAAANSPLATGFASTRRQQAQARRTPRNRIRRLRRTRWFAPAVGLPAILMLVLVIVASPILWSGLRAYRDVQVGSVDHIQSAFVPRLNPEGTPELVAAPTEASSFNWSGNDPLTILLLGVDKSVNGASRTDTIILVNIDPREKSASMLSIPRDLKVVIPGYGIDKINAAFALGDFNKVQGGGAGLTIRTIEANLGIPISAFVQIDFHGFIDMIDTVGGVTLDVPYPIKDDTYPAENYNYQRIYFPSGWQHMDGEQALQYARTRHQDGDSRRSARQQQVLLAIRDEALDLDLIPQLPTLIGQFGDSVRTDISITDAVRLARLGSTIPRDQIHQLSLIPALYDDYNIEGTYYLSADWEAVGDVLTEFAGTSIAPPGAALVNPDYGIPVLIENGTTNTGLAGRVGDILEANGFWNVAVANADGTGHDRTTIHDRDNNLGTSALITQLIGVGADTITLGNGQIGGSGPPANGQYAIVITLGDDAPDPAGDQWNLQDYQRETDDDGTLENTSSASPGDVVPSPEELP